MYILTIPARILVLLMGDLKLLSELRSSSLRLIC